MMASCTARVVPMAYINTVDHVINQLAFEGCGAIRTLCFIASPEEYRRGEHLSHMGLPYWDTG